jgi:Cys-tRNA(Pro)/Cys-tRNA(Cys) deacylase
VVRGVAKPARVKTNAMRALDARHIPYEVLLYPSTIHSAHEVAALLGVDAGQVFKTLVMVADGVRHLLVMAPGDAEASLRLVARAVGAKSVAMAPQAEAERLTGLLVGGISPLALLGKPFEVYLDGRAGPLESLYINGGQRGLNLRLRVADLLAVTGARLIAATVDPAGEPQ